MDRCPYIFPSKKSTNSITVVSCAHAAITAQAMANAVSMLVIPPS